MHAINELAQLTPWLNLILVPMFGYVINIERRLTKLEQGIKDRQGQRVRRCPIETGTCPIARQRYRTSWIEPENGQPWAQEKESD